MLGRACKQSLLSLKRNFVRCLLSRKMKRKIKNDTPIRIICAVLFATFSFLYINFFQGELLALVQDHLAQGQTTNNTFLTASIITLLLIVVQFLLNKAGQLHGRYEAFSYLPSCALLALITKVDSTFAYSWVQWVLTLMGVAVVYLLGVWLNKNTFEHRETRFLCQITPNLGIFTLLFLFTGWYGNNVPVDYMELAAWKHTHSGKYEKVLGVGKKSADCNADLTALRNLALAKTGQMGDKLFAYPQSYGADGLLMNRYNVQTLSYGATEFYALLGAFPYGGEKAPAFYKRVMAKSDATIYRDMYLSALLLDKDLAAFAAQTSKDLETYKTAAPTHYQEAWIIYNEQHPFAPVDFTPSESVAQRYRDYLALREANADNPIVMQNLSKRHFGNTYWYYYDFVTSK